MFFSLPNRTTIPFLTLVFTISPVAAQPEIMNGTDPSFSLCMAVIVVFMGLFIASFSIYIRYCSSRPISAHSGFLSAAQANKATGGLDRWTIEAFPTFTYAEVKDHKLITGELECAVCLTEFEDTELLRLIPKCDHVFHPECIDEWLGSHVTCPVCRAILDMDSVIDESDETVVQVVCENPPVQERGLEQNRLTRNGSVKTSRYVLGSDGFRSYSTGHSVGNEERVDVERFTLPMTEEQREEILQRAATKEPKPGSGRSQKSFRRVNSLNSPKFLRTPSTKSRDNNCEGSSSSKGSRPTYMIPPIKCIDLKPISHVMVDPV